MNGGENGDGEGRMKIAWPLVCRCMSEEDLRVMVGCFAEVCRRRGLRVNAGKSKGWC